MCSTSWRRKCGFTLLEVMIASGLLAALLIGSFQFWRAIDQQTTDLLIKQKAVFVLNAEMERLSALYQRTGFGTLEPAYIAGKSLSAYAFEISGQWQTYASNLTSILAAANQNFTTTSLDDFLHGSEHLVYVQGSKPAGTSPPAHVWIDKSRSVSGQIVWATEAIEPSTCAFNTCACLGFSGSGAGNCLELELSIVFPFRLDKDDEWVSSGTLQTISLRTIIGRY